MRILSFKRTFLCVCKQIHVQQIYVYRTQKQTFANQQLLHLLLHVRLIVFSFYQARNKNNKPSLYCHINTEETTVQKLYKELTVHVGFCLPTEADGWGSSQQSSNNLQLVI